VTIIQLELVNRIICKKAYSLLYHRMGLDTWGNFLMLTCVKKYSNDLIFIYSSDVLDQKIRLLMKQICPYGHFELHFIPVKKT
jgi:hypothetical protein